MQELKTESVKIDWDSEQEILRVALTGEIRWPMIDAALTEAVRLHDLPPKPDMLWDCRRMAFTEVTVDRLRLAADNRAEWIKFFSGAHVAYIVASEADAKILALFNAVTPVKGQKTEGIFRGLAQAEQWLFDLRSRSD